MIFKLFLGPLIYVVLPTIGMTFRSSSTRSANLSFKKTIVDKTLLSMTTNAGVIEFTKSPGV